MLLNHFKYSLLLFTLALIQFSPTTAQFSTEIFFNYIDLSCKDSPTGPINANITLATSEMKTLIQSTLSDGFTLTGGRINRAFRAFWGEISVKGLVRLAPEGIQENYQRLNSVPLKTFSLYCDSSAFELIKAWPADTPKGPGWGTPGQFVKNGFWYIKDPRRRIPGGSFIIATWPGEDGSYPELGADICASESDAISQKSGRFMLLCPDAVTYHPGSLADLRDKKVKTKTSLDKYLSAGGVMLHELSHLVLGTEDYVYGAGKAIGLVRKGSVRQARKNADSYVFYALAVWVRGVEWYKKGKASPIEG